jgi:uncharacterized membrane protein YedE/YeeE
MIQLFALLSGLVFGIGLCLSGMTDPGKVLGFLDLAGEWDPSLVLVMGGAVAIGAVAFALAGRRARTWVFGDRFELPTRRDIDARLVAGSLTFGIGWGLAGICPGPAIALLGLGRPEALVFVVAMLAGMLLYDLSGRKGRTLAAGQAAQDS